MGQEEVFKILNERKEFMTADEICDLCNSAYGCVIRALNIMFKFGEVEKKFIEEKRHSIRKISVWRIKIK